MANEKRLIWDEDAKRHLIALAVGHHTETLHIDMILNAILHHAPTVDAVEVVHGRWAVSRESEISKNVWCTACGEDFYIRKKIGAVLIDKMPYCPNCGAKMDGERREGE